jgi:hypothetical protein
MNDEIYANITVKVYLADAEAISNADYEVDVDALHRDIEYAVKTRMERHGQKCRVKVTE